MPPRLRLTFAALTGVLLLIPALALYREIVQRNDIWWTPPDLALSLAESQDRVQILVRGKQLSELVSAGQVQVTDEAGATRLAANDLRFRFNNWDRVRASRLPMLLTDAAAIGAGLVILVLMVTGRLAYSGERSPVAA